MGNLINGTAIMITGEIESKNVFFGCASLPGSKGKRLVGVYESTWKIGNTSYTNDRNRAGLRTISGVRDKIIFNFP